MKQRIAMLVTALALGTLAATTTVLADEATTATPQDTWWGATDTTTPADTGWGIAPTDGTPGTVTPDDTWWG